ncbi:MAG TPA: PilZ domain-containing protein [Desulfobacterales bacterium]|nr:PilZ domain-containing protein [Desulfobacterales bacterium]
MDERRKHRRFQVDNGAFAVLGGLSWSHSTQKLGQITDIGMGGLAFSYIASEELSDDSVELNIFLAENRFHLRKIPFKTIWDIQTEKVPFSSITMRRSGVEFGELTPDQRSQLKYFIRNHTLPLKQAPSLSVHLNPSPELDKSCDIG